MGGDRQIISLYTGMLEGNKFFGKKKQKDKGAKGMGSARRAGWGEKCVSLKRAPG